MRAVTGAPGARIVALGHYQPARVVTNDELAQRVDTNDEWIRSRVGVVTRRIAAEDESVADMAFAAAGKALAHSGLSTSDIDMIVVASCTERYPIPSVAGQVSARLQLTAPAAIDLNTACSGFSYAIATAQHAILAGAATHALVVGAEKLSAITDWDDRSTCVILGDGAGAAVVSATATAEENGIGPVVWGSVPDKVNAIRLTEDTHLFTQEGQAVFRWATSAIAPLALQACERAGIDPGELGAFVPHQANLRIIEPIAKKLGADNAIVARDIVESGNTSAASIPLALSKLVERGEIASGTPTLIIGFGAGLTYSGQVVICP